MKIFSSLLLLLLSFKASADIVDPGSSREDFRPRQNAWQIFSDGAETSEDYSLSTLTFSYASDRHDIFWPFEGESTKALNFWANYNLYSGSGINMDWAGSAIWVGVDRKHSKSNSTRVGVGVHKLNYESDQREHSIGVGLIEQKLILNDETLYLSFGLSQDLAYTDLLMPASVTHFMVKRASRMDLLYVLPKWLRTRADIQYSDYSGRDAGSEPVAAVGSYRMTYKVESLYGISRDWPWIWLGPFYEAISGSRNVVGYWSPEKFKTYGLKLDAAFPVYGVVSGFAELKQYKLKEEDLDWGSGYSNFLGLQIGKRDSLSIQIGYSKIKSSQSGSAWTQEGWRLSSSASY